MGTRAAIFVVAGAAVVACGLDVVGTVDEGALDPRAVRAPDDAGVVPERIGDGDEAVDAAAPGETPPGTIDAGACSKAVLVDNFVDGLGKWAHFGDVEQQVSPSANAYARLIEAGKKNRAAGLFWLPSVGAKAFKASFTYHVTTPNRGMIMGDGLTFTWLTSTGILPLGVGAVTGRGLGLQPGAVGYAFALDAWQNPLLGDLPGPSFGFLELDPARGSPGSYQWHIAKNGPYRLDDVYDAWRTIEITVADGHAAAKFRFVPGGTSHSLFAGVPVDTTSTIVAMGFTASTGSAEAMGFAVDAVAFELTDATCD